MNSFLNIIWCKEAFLHLEMNVHVEAPLCVCAAHTETMQFHPSGLRSYNVKHKGGFLNMRSNSFTVLDSEKKGEQFTE